MTYRYRADVLEHLWRHGVQPRPTTPPELVRGYVNDLYRYEIRKLRDRARRREFPLDALAGHVIELRRRYPLISLKPKEWLAD